MIHPVVFCSRTRQRTLHINSIRWTDDNMDTHFHTKRPAAIPESVVSSVLRNQRLLGGRGFALRTVSHPEQGISDGLMYPMCVQFRFLRLRVPQ
ncbi:hypothetical protein N7468_007551 [Penicillium chermesinum]|uniref:Uncharacterized protein n=1 Tax=Penicillium chermesinum TaxID=63820 RepID=A0A9W9TKP0_9EURO|nr:uncharacterized protein N7468_007551 [Penicillium chermesinum]KAJ5226326.1 hypothetical protein N7468_007551 [Penicillium chermesinum]